LGVAHFIYYWNPSSMKIFSGALISTEN